MTSQRAYKLSYRPRGEMLNNQTRWTVPQYIHDHNECDQRLRLSFGDFQTNESPFGFTLRNPTHRETFWLSTKDRNLVLSDKYLELGFEVHSQEIFGWGERTRNFTLSEGEYTIWPTGIRKDPDPGELGHQTYGDHPFVLARLNDKTYLGLFLQNSNAKVLKYTHTTQGRSILNFKAVGGILEMYAFMGDTAEQVLREYHQVIGLPALPPVHALGFHQGSVNYTNDETLQQSVKKFKEAHIPLEGVWLDEQFMRNYRTFNVDKTRFGGLKAFQAQLEKDHQYLGLSMHPCIPVYNEDGSFYDYFIKAYESKRLIRSGNQNTTFAGDTLIGEHLPGACAYLDMNGFGAWDIYDEGLSSVYADSGFRMIQMNYNEVTQFCHGECPQEEDSSKNIGHRFSNLPFNPLGSNTGDDLETLTISSNAILSFYKPEEEEMSVYYNAHALYGSQMAQMARAYMVHGQYPKRDNRALILTRSTFAGAGSYGGHWLGDHGGTFQDMKYSISNILNFQLFGIPLTGANICGNDGRLDEEVCARWYQLGAFSPFARTFEGLGLDNKEPWALTGKYLTAARNALTLRLSFVRYFYTVMFEASQNGGSFWRPLFFEFPEDDEAVKDPEHSFMIGQSLKLTPVSQSVSDGEKVRSYFPAGTGFIDAINWHDMIGGNNVGSYEELTPSWDFPLLHMRHGRIIPYQDFNTSQTTYDLVQNSQISLIIFADEKMNAEGTVYIDTDGTSQSTLDKKTYQYYKMTFYDRQMRVALVDGKDTGGQLDMNQIIDRITIVNAAGYSDTNFACKFNQNMEPSPINYLYDEKTKILNLYAMDATQVIDLRNLRAINFGNSETDPNICNPKYTISNVKMEENSPNAGKQMRVSVEATSMGMWSFDLKISLIKNNLINVDIIPEFGPIPFEIPNIVLNDTLYPVNKFFATDEIASYITLSEVGEDFYFEIHSKNAPSDVIYSTKGQPFVLTPFYKMVGAKVLTNGRVFGLGERMGDFWKGAGIYTIWNKDNPQVVDDGTPPGKQLYGSHPIYFAQRSKDMKWIGVYNHHSGPQDFVFEAKRDGYEINNLQTTGRTNLFFLMPDTIQNVVQNYHDLVGRPMLPPEWAFGWHQSRFGYNTTQSLRDVLQGYKDTKIPLDGLWSDIDILDDFKDFEFNERDFPDFQEFINELHEHGSHYIPIIGAGISAGDSKAYFEGQRDGVFIKAPNRKNEALIGRSTPGDSVFVDYLYHGTGTYWQRLLERYYNELSFDGLWLDMNEITSLCDAVCYQDQRSPLPIDNRLFYWPGGRDLERGTISIDTVSETGDSQLDLHNLYGLLQSFYTARYFIQKEQRPFLISRSTFAGSGKYSGHWSGDNTADFPWLAQSIDHLLLFNSFGIPYTGSDVCGFKKDTSALLCAKWYKAAILYPLSRNNNDLGQMPQEPYQPFFDTVVDFANNFTAKEIIKKAMYIKYGLHAYSYTQYHKASTSGIQAVKPLFYSFPNDPESYEYINHNLMLGDYIKASIDVFAFTRSTFIFPEKGTEWCPIWPGVDRECFPGGSVQSLSAPPSEVLLHLRSGSIVPLQLTSYGNFKNFEGVKNLADLKNFKTDMGLFIDRDMNAEGFVRFDDGVTTNLELYDELALTATGYDPTLIGYPHIDINVKVVRNKSLARPTRSTMLGDILIYKANERSFIGRTTGVITLIDGRKIKLTAKWEEKPNITRLSYLDGVDDFLWKEISTIHLEANQ